MKSTGDETSVDIGKPINEKVLKEITVIAHFEDPAVA